ncbi:podocalyxin [Amblyraja radiata]|uniref:podocalyxin n=1 Tax=Amblyraja radiata TaxID=386614 RepID=UPI001403CD82|nr:podocalyxin [Amblyraja radiata]
MRLLILLSFLGSWSIIGSDNSSTLKPTIATENKATETKHPTTDPATIQGQASTSAPSSTSTLMTKQLSTSPASPNQTQSVTKSTVPSSQSNGISTTAQNSAITPTLGSTSPTDLNHSSTLHTTATSGVRNNPTENIATTAKSVTTHAVGTAMPPSSSTRGSASASASSNPESTVTSGKSTATPSQGSSTTAVPTSTPSSVSVAKPNTPTESIVPKASTERTNGSGVETVTSATGKVKNITMSKAWVKNTTSMMQTNATSGAFTDGTGHSVKSTLSKARRNAMDRLPGAASTTLKPKSNDTISSTAYCVNESSNQNHSLQINENMDCETILNQKGKALADDICSRLVKAAGLRGVDICEVQFSLEKEPPGKLYIDVSFKVSDFRIDDVLKEFREAKKEVSFSILALPIRAVWWCNVIAIDGLFPPLYLGIQELNPGNGKNKQRQSATELKKLIAMVVTGSLLLLVFLSAIVYRCSQRKSKHKDPYLTEELRTVDNGCHDNPAMDITERESEMEEKNNSKATYLENNDGWIVPMATHIKDGVEEEDTHL